MSSDNYSAGADVALKVLTHEDLGPLIWDLVGLDDVHALMRTHRMLHAHAPLRTEVAFKMFSSPAFMMLICGDKGKGKRWGSRGEDVTGADV